MPRAFEIFSSHKLVKNCHYAQPTLQHKPKVKKFASIMFSLQGSHVTANDSLSLRDKFQVSNLIWN